MSNLTQKLELAESRLRKKLSGLDLEAIGISEYNQRYLADKIHYLDNALAIYRDILETSFLNSCTPFEKSVFIDYGGGSGVLTLFARELGVRTVIYNDIYDISCRDMGILARALEVRVEHIICGDIDAVVSYVIDRNIAVDVIASYDVLEHIYDVKSHFEQLGFLPNLTKLRVVYASGANILNPRYVRKVKKRQLEVEYKGRKEQWGRKGRDSSRAFFDIRRDIIRNYAPELSSEEVEWLGRITRGLIECDIKKCIDEYRRNEKVLYRPMHPTNTCDPYTGNWEEHLMTPEHLTHLMECSGFMVKIKSGRYSRSGSLPKVILKKILNLAIRFLGKRSLFIAPYYMVCAEKEIPQR